MGNIVHAKDIVGMAPVVSSISGLLAVNTAEVSTITVTDYHVGLEGGGGVFVWDSSRDKADHNGGTVIDPTRVFPTTWTDQGELTTWFTAGTGTGCWVRKQEHRVSIRSFGAKGDGTTDNAIPIQSALNASKSVFVPDGVYLIDGPFASNSGMEVQDGQTITGESANAVLLQGTIRFMLTAGTRDGGTTLESGNKRNIRITNLTLRNDAVVFNEQQHLLMLSAVSDVLIKNCNFIGYRGDGVYLGQGTTGTVERHNYNVTIKDCLFDGVNNENRNGVSIIDGEGVHVIDCKFIRSSRADMPGPVDFEPNSGTHNAVGRDITVEDCKFYNCLGSAAFYYYTPTFIMTPSAVCRDTYRLVAGDVTLFSARSE